MENIGAAMIVGVPLATAMAWLVTLHSRVRAHTEQLHDMKADLRYIRERIDRAVSHT
jgi:uncharacterized protein (DUF3084 family)